MAFVEANRMNFSFLINGDSPEWHLLKKFLKVKFQRENAAKQGLTQASESPSETCLSLLCENKKAKSTIKKSGTKHMEPRAAACGSFWGSR
jgi:hypothetical protein